jgi:hypothetical protein
MLNYRRQQRETKSVEGAEKSMTNCPTNHAFHEAKKYDDEVLRQYITHDRINSALPTTTTNFWPKEITAVDPFNAFPIKIELYMLELLSSCGCLPPYSLLSAFCISSKRCRL